MKIKVISLLYAVLLLLLCACAQSQVDSDRLLNNTDNAETSPSEASNLTNNEEAVQDDDLPAPVTPNELEEYSEAVGNVLEMNFFGYGQVKYYVNDVNLADSMDAAGIDEAIYQLSGNRRYDYYLAISMTVENVDVPVDDEKNAEAIRNYSHMNDFQIQSAANVGEPPALLLEPKYFDKGGMKDTDAKRYFEYALPNIGETLDVVIAFGLPSEALDTIQTDSVALYLCNTITGDMMEIKDLL